MPEVPNTIPYNGIQIHYSIVNVKEGINITIPDNRDVNFSAGLEINGNATINMGDFSTIRINSSGNGRIYGVDMQGHQNATVTGNNLTIDLDGGYTWGIEGSYSSNKIFLDFSNITFKLNATDYAYGINLFEAGEFSITVQND